MRPTDERLLARLRLVFRLLSFSPHAAGGYATKLFQSPRKFRRPEWEERIAVRARRFDFVGNRGKTMHGYLWAPEGASFGERPVVALMHGWEGRASQLGAFVDPLVAAGFIVVGADAPGHGARGDPGSLPGLANPVVFAETLHRLSHRVGGFHAVLAHSLGALGTAVAFEQGLTANKAVLVAPATSPRMATATMADLLDLSPRVLHALQGGVERATGYKLDDIEDGRIFEHIFAEVLVVHDVDDQEVSALSAEAVAEATGARVRWTQGLGHRRILRDQDVIERVVRFLSDGPLPSADPWRAFLHSEFPMGSGLEP